jgi:hypothetical protein
MYRWGHLEKQKANVAFISPQFRSFRICRRQGNDTYGFFPL